ETDIPMNQVFLSDIIDLHKDKSYLEGMTERLKLSELFSLLSGTGHILVFTDERGLLSDLKNNKEDGSTQDFIEFFSKYDGVAIILSTYKKGFIPKWSKIFHEIFSLDGPEISVRSQYWKNMINGTVQLESSIDLEEIVTKYNLSIEQIQEVMHRVCLLKAAENSDTILRKDIIESTVLKINAINSGNGILFG
ncbi:hypothetical protein ACFL40_05955, partial [candidate division KSB1 bacterium]